MAKGIVYIVQNPAFPHLFKIGRTEQDTVKDRGLNASNVPEDFDVLFGYECNNPKEVEEHLHEDSKEFRHYTKTGRKTEFFYICCLQKARKTLELLRGAREISGDYISLERDNKSEYDETKNIEQIAKKGNSFTEVYNYIKSLGENISIKEAQVFYAFKKNGKNFICMRKNKPILLLELNPKTVKLEKGFTRDMTGIGKFGTGNLEVKIKNETDFEKAKHLIERAYKEN